MPIAEQKTIYLKDYTVPEFLITHTDLHFDLSASDTIVRSRLTLRRNPACPKANPDLVLMGEDLILESLALNDKILTLAQYTLTDETLSIPGLDGEFTIDITNRINPSKNTALSGLYQSNDMLCTQCEAEGFRRITWFLDRPDVMSIFSVTITADKDKYPILLSNGNRTKHAMLDNGQHQVSWHDPFPKPAYLFALVAGDLACLNDSFTTCSGRHVTLEVYVEEHDLDKTDHAMQSLKQAMRWDEEAFGREYDLDLYMIVAVSHFNMGAMENKGLNIFNTKYVLASTKTATDTDFENIEAVIGHEYFHNWSGNRVTCRDWFQLSLKEGFTVFRDQQFTAHQTSDAVKRINDVNMLRTHQFAEDAGPLSHPIRPASFVEINNFYTLTIYEKGAEVVRMIYTLLGEKLFREGCDLYFKRHDGQAVTTEEFVKAMEDVSTKDLTQFKHWYSQAGTPVVTVNTHYDATAKTYAITFEQHCTTPSNQATNEAFHIPITVGLLNDAGEEITLPNQQTSATLELTHRQQTFTFDGIDAEPTPSILRKFSAPIKLNQQLSLEQQIRLFRHDSDTFNRWEAGQNCLSGLIFNAVTAIQNNKTPSALPSAIVDTFQAVLQQPLNDLAYQTQLLSLPSKAYLAEQMDLVDINVLYQAHHFVKQSLADALTPLWLSNYKNNHHSGAAKNSLDMAQRSFKNLCLSYLMAADEADTRVCTQQLDNANNMTDQIAALSQVSHLDKDVSAPYFNTFYQQWRHEDLVIDKWFSLQACSERAGTLQDVLQLLEHPDFDIKTPNRVRSLISAFATGNPLHFNAADGSGYQFIADNIIKLDAINPQIAARLANSLSRWKKLDSQRQEQIKQQLMRIQSHSVLSGDVLEIVTRSLSA
ncbi:MAG: aminopeptidase N [Piscirickettsiaceae bacterium]|nr:MAG: aminopeptidase N [Piscirickettsiaceae bacterium]PCI70288.1 MAG: aminopeptidase N [Piscirickettsiaceae bacterium]